MLIPTWREDIVTIVQPIDTIDGCQSGQTGRRLPPDDCREQKLTQVGSGRLCFIIQHDPARMEELLELYWGIAHVAMGTGKAQHHPKRVLHFVPERLRLQKLRDGVDVVGSTLGLVHVDLSYSWYLFPD